MGAEESDTGDDLGEENMGTKKLRAIAGAAGALIAGAALLAGCGGDETPGAQQATSTSRASVSATATTAVASPTHEATPTAAAEAPGNTPDAAPTSIASQPTAVASRPTQAAPPPAPTATPAAQAQAITVVARGVQFVSASFNVAPGPLTVTLDNQDIRVPHDVTFSVPGGGDVAGTAVIAGPGSGTTSFTAWPGTYSFVCTLHPNMTGTLTVQ